MPALTRPHGEARDDYAIFAGLAERLGTGKDFTEGRTALDWLRHLYDAVAGRPGRAGTCGTRLRRVLGGRGPRTAGGQRAAGGVRRLPRRPRRSPAHARRPARSRSSPRPSTASSTTDCPGHPVWLEPDEWLGATAARRFPLHLVANQPRSRLHSQLDVGAHSQSVKIAGREPVRMHPADAAARGLRDGDVVRIFNDRGACLAGLAVDDALRPGVVQLSTGAWYDPDPADAGILPSRQPQRAHRRPPLVDPQPGLHRPAGTRRDRAVPRHPAGAFRHQAARDRLTRGD